MRVAAHNGARAFGGGERWTLLLLAGLARRGHDVHLFCRDRGMVARAAEHGVPASVGRLGGHLMAGDAVRLAGELRRYRPDALLVGTFRKLWLAALAGRLARVPRTVVRIGLSTDLPGRHWTYRLALRHWSDAVLVNAEATRAPFVRDLPEIASKVATVHDGVAIASAPGGRRTARRSLGIPLDALVVGSVARLCRQKRLDRAIDAVSLLPGVHLVLAGSGALEAELRLRARSLGMEGRVHFLGFREDVGTVLAALDLLLVTSEREGMANAMLEALAAGVPVVSAPVSGAAEALDAWEGAPPAGVVVRPEPPAIAAAVGSLLDRPGERRRMAAEGRRRARTRFSFERMLDAWERVLAGGPPAEEDVAPRPAAARARGDSGNYGELRPVPTSQRSASSATAASSTAVSPE